MKLSHHLADTRLHAAIGLILGSSSAQALVYDTNQLVFTANNQSIWSSGSSQALNVQAFAGFNLPANSTQIGGIDSGFGAEATIGIQPGGKIGFNIGAGFDTGSVNAKFSANAKLNIADAVAGNTYVSLGTASVNNISSGFSTSLGNPYYYEDFVLNLPIKVGGQVCAFGGCSGDSKTFNISPGPLELAALNRNGDGKYTMWGIEQNIQYDQPYPVNIGVDYGPVNISTNVGSVTVHNPALNSNATSNSGVASSSTTVDLIDFNLDVSNIISLNSGRGAQNLQLGLGPFSLDLTPYAVNATASLSLDQGYTLNSNMMVDLHFNHLVMADLSQIYADSSIRTVDDLIIPVGMFDKLKLSFSQDTKVTPTFMVNNQFTSVSSMDIGLDFSLTLLKASFDYTAGSIGFDGFTQELKNLGNLANVNLYGTSHELSFSKVTGDAFTVKALSNNLPSHYALWEGLGSNGNWGTTANWQSGRAPVDGDALVFLGSNGGQTSPNLENANPLSTANGISFIEGAAKFNVHGHDLSNTGDIINQSSVRQLIQMNLNVAANQRWDGGSSGLDYVGNLLLDKYNLSLIDTHVTTTETAVIGDSHAASLNLSAASGLTTAELDIGRGKNGTGKVFITDQGTQVAINDKLLVGGSGHGILTIESAAAVTTNTADFAMDANSQAELLIDTAAVLTIHSNANFAQSGRLNVSVQNSGGLLTHDVKMATAALSQAQVRLQGNGSTWQAGGLSANGLGDSLIQVNAGSYLTVGKNLNLGGGGGNSELDANNGLIVVAGNLNEGDKGSIYLAGQGKMLNENLLIVAKHTDISGKGINLNNAGAQFQQGVKLNGNLNASGTSHVDGDVLLVAGTGTIIDQAGSLTFNGKVEDSGGSIVANQSASIHFQSDVHGNGSFSGGGNLSFAGGFSTGNRPSSINFGGDNVSFEQSSSLTLQLDGLTPGSQYDQLQHIGHLSFQGSLMLAFSHFAADSFGILNLFDFQSFSGIFADNLIQIQGLDRSRLDFSQLALNGELILNAAPVPLPAAFWLFGGGLFAFYAPARLNRQTAVQDKALA